MAEKLGIGARFPEIRIQTVEGHSVLLPGDVNSKYKVILFYRGHW